MKALELVAEGQAPDGTPLTLHRKGAEWLIRAGGQDLMSSRAHGSEQEMVRLAGPFPANARVLVGGLGMGFTLRAALDAGPRVVVAELSPDVVEWNQRWLGDLAGRPLDDPRTELRIGDVADALTPGAGWNAVLLDVDNGPEAFTQAANAGLYSRAGLHRAREALAPGGALAVWSGYEVTKFPAALERAGLRPEVHRVRAHAGRGARHVIYVGRR